jgi:hypothetical protein
MASKLLHQKQSQLALHSATYAWSLQSLMGAPVVQLAQNNVW